MTDSTIDFRGLRCLVLGGGGFIGQNLCNELLAAGAEVTSFSRSLGNFFDNTQINKILGRFDDRVALSNAIEGQDIVFHLISGSLPASSNRDPSAEMTTSPLATVHLLDICRTAKVKKIIFASSGGTIYGIPDKVPIDEKTDTNPISAYGISKLTIEKHLHLYYHLYGLKYISLRIANPYGRFQFSHKKQGLIGTLAYRAILGMPIEIWGNGEVIRDFIHIDDVTKAFMSAVYYEGDFRIFNVGSGNGVSVNEIIQDIEILLDNGPIKRVEMPGRAADVPTNILDISRIMTELKWSPQVGWNIGLQSTINWVKEYCSIEKSARYRPDS